MMLFTDEDMEQGPPEMYRSDACAKTSGCHGTRIAEDLRNVGSESHLQYRGSTRIVLQNLSGRKGSIWNRKMFRKLAEEY